MTTRLTQLESLAEICTSQGWMLATAESCTGGGIAKAMTEVAGSSSWFTAGLVTYSNTSKEKLLGVQPASLATGGAVSEAVVKEMVAGACLRTGADFALATSGVAGPGGGTPEKPVGTVWIAWGSANLQQALKCHFPGDRRAIREASIDQALQLLKNHLEKAAAG
ncbi:CinA family protein [Marinospirillum perlucidum]|uniref:CinA family protein n=1 Tax=Marinospirillum perlucidum TaxID=1982602 RepID=UPI000DF2C9C1|nr:CinA family protein [Marinospirillum perlucidum]